MSAAILFLAAILAAVALWPALVARREAALTAEMMSGAEPFQAAALRAQNAMLAMQTAERGYELSGRSALADRYRDGRAELRQALDDAALHAPHDAGELVEGVRRASERWMAEVAEPHLAEVAHGHRDRVALIEQRGDGEEIFGALRASVESLVGRAQQDLSGKELHRRRLARLLDGSLVGLGIAGLLGVGLLAFVLRASLELRDEAEQARATNRQKDEFLSLVGHEVRTPVTVIRLLAESIRRHAGALDAWSLERLQTMERQAQRIAWLVDELLDVGTTSGTIELARQPVDAVELTLRALRSVQTTAPKYPLHYSSTVRAATADLDGPRIEQVLTHLLSNAVKFSPAPQPVHVQLDATDDEVRWEISDHGVGIPRRDQKHLFERFFRASNTPHLRASGIGLGLHLSQVIVAAHGGRIWFESTPHRGTTFHIALPRHPQAAPNDRAPQFVVAPTTATAH